VTSEINQRDRQSFPATGTDQVSGSKHATKTNEERETDLELLENTVRAAGKIALKFFTGHYRRWSKVGGSPVTEADLAVDAFLKEELHRARPDYGWLSEESLDDPARLDARRVFIVDPIDGTVAFMKGRPHFTICAAVVESGRPLSGVVFNPARDECFTGQESKGAHLNGIPIHVGGRSVIEGCKLLGNRALFTDWPPMQIENFSSIAYRVALVAAGQFDAMVSLTGKRDWDLAAADIIIREAGGRLVDLDGREPVYNVPAAIQGATIAAGPGLIDPLLTALRQKNSLKS
jgi:myo-inositol-1(or 4)-monophosphatase